MRKSPIIKPLNKDSGTLYVFQSSSDLLTRTISGSNFDIKFDKFALLELPKIGEVNKNGILLSGIGSNSTNTISSIPVIGGLNADKNIELATAFQNYCLAFENEILNNQQNTEYQTSSEKIWWKFLSSVGAIRFRNGINSEINSEFSNIDNFLEGDLVNNYSNVVKYIGLTNGTNVNSLNNMTSSEIFINVGSNIKRINKTYFKKNLTDSYKEVNLSTDLISGFDINNQRIYLDGHAWFDDISNKSWKVNTSKFTEESYEGRFTNTNIQHQNIIRTKSDVATIDWNSKLYDVDSISKIPGVDEDFKFNTVLIYYTILVNGQEFTNLYGVYFTGGFDFNSNELKSKLKIVPKLNLGESGNSYNFKIQLRVESHSGQNNITSIDNGISAVDLFNRLMTPLNINNLNLNSVLKQITILNKEIDSLKNQFSSILKLKEDFLNIISNQENLPENFNSYLSEINSDVSWLKRQFNSEPSNLIFDRGLDVQNLADGKKVIQSVAGLKTIKNININYSAGNGSSLNSNNSNIIQLLNTSSRINLEIPEGCFELTLNLKIPTSKLFEGYVIRIKNINLLNLTGTLKINLIKEDNISTQFLAEIIFLDLQKPIELICSNLSPIEFEIDKF